LQDSATTTQSLGSYWSNQAQLEGTNQDNRW